MAIGFFDGERQNASPESIKRRRELAARMMAGLGRAPRDTGEGLNAVGQALASQIILARSRGEEERGMADAARVQAGFFGGGAPMAAVGGAPVATGSGATRVVAAPEQFAQLFAEKEAKHSLPQGYLARAAQIESNFNPSAKNPNSSAGGLFQFIDGTARQYGLRNRFDPVEATAAAARLAADNRDFLARRLGREPSAGELYLAHQQGAGGAAKLLANPDALASSVVGNAAARLNRGAGMTAGAFANQWINKFGTPVVRPGPGATPMPLQTASAGPQSNDAQMQDGAGELQAGGSGLMAEPAVYRGQLNDVPTADLMQRGPMPALPPGFDVSSLVSPAGQPSVAMAQGIAENEDQTRMMEAQMAAQQGLPYAGNEPPAANQSDVFSPVPMGGGFNPFVPRDMVQPDDAIAQAPAPMSPQMDRATFDAITAQIPPAPSMDRATFDQVTAGLPQRAPAFTREQAGIAPSWAGNAEIVAPGAQEVSGPRQVVAPIPPQRPADLGPQSPFVPPAMRQPMPVDMGGENGATPMAFIQDQFARQDQARGIAPRQIYNPFIPQAAQAPQMAGGGGSAPVATQAAPMAGEPAQAPTSRMQQLAAVVSNPFTRPEIRQLAVQMFQQEQAQALAVQERARAEAQTRRVAQDLNIPESLAGNQAAVAARVQQMYAKPEGATTDQRELEQVNRERQNANLPALRMDEWKTQKARAGATSIAVDASQKAESAFSVETGKALAKRFDEMVGEGDAAAQNLEVVADLRRLGTGIGTGAYAVVQSYLGKLGVKTEGLSQIEAYNALIDRLTPQQRLPGSGATSDFDAKMFKGSLTSLMNTPEGNALIVDSMERIIDNRMKRGDIALRVQTGELSQREGLAEIRKLQAQARDISTAARDFGKPKTTAPDRPGAPTAPGASSPKLADPLGIR